MAQSESVKKIMNSIGLIITKRLTAIGVVNDADGIPEELRPQAQEEMNIFNGQLIEMFSESTGAPWPFTIRVGDDGHIHFDDKRENA